jgi:hypothetical protein
MKPADNFDLRKFITENKITTQSRLNENSRSDMWKLDVWELDGRSFGSLKDVILYQAIKKNLISREYVDHPDVQDALEYTIDNFEPNADSTPQQAYQKFKEYLGAEESPY